MRKIVIFLFAGFLFGFSGLIVAQKPPLSSSFGLYTEGKQLFLHKDYAASQQVLKSFLRTNVDKELLQEGEYMLACIAYELKYQNRIEILRDYLDKYPDSPYANRIQSLLASSYFLMMNIMKRLQFLILVIWLC